MHPAGRNAHGTDLLTLVLSGAYLIVGVGDLKPGTREEEIQVQSIR